MANARFDLREHTSEITVSNREYAPLEEVRKSEFLGHPIGLWALFTTEMWERFCYYGMRALLVLYLIATLTDRNPGFGWSEEQANELYGWFTGLVYLFPLLGGFLADRFLGQHRSVLLGGILMAFGEFCLFYTEYFRQGAIATITPYSAPGAFWCFMSGLFLITLGNGFFKPCISVMVGELYEKNDPRRDGAFTIFYMGINVGALLAPFVAGSIGENISWHWGFLTACIGMCFGLCTYSILRPKYLGKIGMKRKSEPSASNLETDEVKATAPLPKSALTRVERDRIAVILTLTFFCIAFWSVFEQAGTSLNIFAKKETNRQVPAKVGQNLPGFLANQDELDAKIAMNELRGNLYRLVESINAFGDDIETLPSELQTLAFSQKFDEAETRVDELQDSLSREEHESFDRDLNSVKEAYDSAVFSLGKANRARQKAGIDPLDLSVEDFASFYEKARAEQEDINTEVEGLFTQKVEELGSSDQGILDNFKAGLKKDVEKSRQEKFLETEKANIDAQTAIYTFPTTWYQSVNPLCVVIFAPLFNLLWGALRRKNLEPSTPVKFGIGLIMLSRAFMFMISGALHSANTNGNAGAYWLLFTYVFCTWGELCLSPVGLSMVSKLAPARYASLLMGIWFLSSAVAGYLSGKLAAALGSGDNTINFFFNKGLMDFFLVLTAAPLIAGIIVFLLSPMLRKMMHEND